MLESPVTMAVIADVHYGPGSQPPKRYCEVADALLARTVRYLKHAVRPDVTLVLGDILDDGGLPGSQERLSKLRAMLDTLDAPYIAIPGNHDGDIDLFYQTFPRPRPAEDVGGIRFLTFLDQDEPEYNARRSPADLDRLRSARKGGYAGPLVALQHVCLSPVACSVTPYNYVNAPEIIAAMAEANVTLSVSGHHHWGAEDTRDGEITFVNAPGLCVAPFSFVVITMDSDEIRTERHALATIHDADSDAEWADILALDPRSPR